MLVLPLAFLAVGVALVGLADIGSLPFDNPELWWLLGVAPMAGLLFLYGRARRRRALHRFTSVALAPILAAGISPARQAMRAGLVVLAILLSIVALIGPRWGMYLEKQRVHGIDVVVALDVSRSMLADDVKPNRLEYAKRIIRQQLVERAVFQRSNRLALLAFAGSTSLKAPLTTDHLNFQTRLESLQVGAAPRGGTAIGQAIDAAADLLSPSPEEAVKIIMIFTDGEDHEGGPVEAAKQVAEEQGIKVFTIGVGDPSRTVGVQLPTTTSADRRPMLHQGQIVFSKLNVAALQEIAQAGGGRYAALEDLRLLVDAVAGMKSAELTTEERRRHKPQYQWFVAAALVLIGLETLISERRRSAEGPPQRAWRQEMA